MEEPSSPPQQPDQLRVVAVESTPNPTVQESPPPPPPPLSTGSNGNNYSKPLIIDEKNDKKRKKVKNKGAFKGVSAQLPSSSSFCGSSSSSPYSLPAKRVVLRRRNPRPLLGTTRRSEGNVDAIGLPLGMSVAAVVSLVLETKDTSGGRMNVDHLSMICTSAVRESLVNVFGDKFDCFMRNFEDSFGTTLRTLNLINNSDVKKGGAHFSNPNVEGSTSDLTLNKGGCTSNSDVEDFPPETILRNFMSRDQFNAIEEVRQNMPTDSSSHELALPTQRNQVACITTSTSGSAIRILSTIEKSVIEQTRSNDLKTLELGLTMEKLKLKRTGLALNSESNHLGREKLAMGISKASFKTEKFKNQLEETRHAELLRKCIDCLVAGLFIMSVSLLYGAYVFSYKRITEAAESCAASSMESKSWWIPKPMASVNSGFNILRCQVQVVSRMLFGVLMIVMIAFLLLKRSTATKQVLPVTSILLLLGVACGLAGKLCVDTLGGSGYHWLLYWETLCLLHFIFNENTSALFIILHGPVDVSQGTKGKAIVPYWIRQSLFYAILLVFLPVSCGLMPFASLGEWKDHFMQLIRDSVFTED